MASFSLPAGYPEPAAGAQSGLERTNGSIGSRQVDIERIEARVGSMASPELRGAASRDQGCAATRHCEAAHH
jgi:hypothetical protein